MACSTVFEIFLFDLFEDLRSEVVHVFKAREYRGNGASDCIGDSPRRNTFKTFFLRYFKCRCNNIIFLVLNVWGQFYEEFSELKAIVCGLRKESKILILSYYCVQKSDAVRRFTVF